MPLLQRSIDPYALFMCNINILIKPNNFEENRCIYFIENRPIYLNGLENLFNRFKLPFFDVNTTTGLFTTTGPRGNAVYHRGNRFGDLTLIRTTQAQTFGAGNADTKFKTGNQNIYMNVNDRVVQCTDKVKKDETEAFVEGEGGAVFYEITRCRW